MERNMKLVEFGESQKGVLRGVLQDPKKDSSKGVIFVGGFERAGTAEPKFRDLASQLYDANVPSLRFDFSGLGLSERGFVGSTVDNWTGEFGSAYDALVSNTGVTDVYVIAHSLGACIVGKFLEARPGTLKGGVLIAPAFNQRDLMRYWFVSGQYKKDPDIEVTWGNYRDLLDEDAFQKDAQNSSKKSKYNVIGSAYFIGSNSEDYSRLFEGLESLFLHVHGDSDIAVPIESISVKFDNKVIVESGDHDMESVDKRELWVGKAVDYILK